MILTDIILSKLTSDGEFDETGDARNEGSKLVEEWIPIFILFYEPVAGLLMSAWNGFKRGILNQVAASFACLCIGFLFGSDIPRRMNLDFVMWAAMVISQNLFDKNSEYVSSDGPMGKDPLHAFELVCQRQCHIWLA